LLVERRGLDRRIRRHAKLVETHAVTQRHLYDLDFFIELPSR
jgi:hypothetical protein